MSVHLGARREHVAPQTRPGGGHVSVTPGDARARTMRAAIGVANDYVTLTKDRKSVV